MPAPFFHLRVLEAKYLSSQYTSIFPIHECGFLKLRKMPPTVVCLPFPTANGTQEQHTEDAPSNHQRFVSNLFWLTLGGTKLIKL